MQMQLSPGTSNCILKSEEWKRAAGMNEAELRVHAPFVAKMNGLLSDKQTPEEWAKASLSDNSVSSDNSVTSHPFLPRTCSRALVDCSSAGGDAIHQ